MHHRHSLTSFETAALVAQGTDRPREHSITKLRDLIGSVELGAHLNVTKFAVLERYPRAQAGESDEPALDDARQAVGYAVQTRRAVQEFLHLNPASTAALGIEDWCG